MFARRFNQQTWIVAFAAAGLLTTGAEAGNRCNQRSAGRAHHAVSQHVVHVPIHTVAYAKPAPADIVDTAVAAGSFKTLATALTEAGLIETLKGKGPFTVFAPTDEAFAKLPEGALEGLLKDKEKLKVVLTYHVVAGKVMAADVVKLKSAKTVQGSEVKIDTTNGVKVDNAKVVKTDIECANGVIHVIDSVILPK